ncbi:unnamed protein product [Ectocarpus sp. 12 AP-2014]
MTHVHQPTKFTKADITTLLHEEHATKKRQVFATEVSTNISGIFRGLKNPKSWTLEETT